jgi:hypothetical protein
MTAACLAGGRKFGDWVIRQRTYGFFNPQRMNKDVQPSPRFYSLVAALPQVVREKIDRFTPRFIGLFGIV